MKNNNAKLFAWMLFPFTGLIIVLLFRLLKRNKCKFKTHPDCNVNYTSVFID